MQHKYQLPLEYLSSKKNYQSGHSYHIQITDQYVQNTGNIPDIFLIHWLTSRVFSLLV